jgi:predicted phage terminase large subunit-like protein
VLERLKRDLGSANFNAQYQQAPLRNQHGLMHLHWFVRGVSTAIIPKARYVQSWDTGIKTAAHHDPSACATFRITEDGHELVDMLVVRLEYPQLKRVIMQHAAQYHAEAILIEDKASGQSLLQDVRLESDLPFIGCMPDADKITRFLRITPLIEAGKVALPDHAHWLADFERELADFPHGRHDDQVDALSQYLNWVRSRGGDDRMRVRRL